MVLSFGNKTKTISIKSLYKLSGGCDFKAVCPDEHFGASQRVNRKVNKHKQYVLDLIRFIVQRTALGQLKSTLTAFF